MLREGERHGVLRWEFELAKTVHFDAVSCIWCISDESLRDAGGFRPLKRTLHAGWGVFGFERTGLYL